MDRGASWAGRDACFAQHRDGSALLQRRLQHAQLGVYALQRVELRLHDLVVALPESVEVEYEAAKIAVGKLAGCAQKAGAAPHAAAIEEPRLSGHRRGALDRLAVLDLSVAALLALLWLRGVALLRLRGVGDVPLSSEDAQH